MGIKLIVIANRGPAYCLDIPNGMPWALGLVNEYAQLLINTIISA